MGGEEWVLLLLLFTAFILSRNNLPRVGDIYKREYFPPQHLSRNHCKVFEWTMDSNCLQLKRKLARYFVLKKYIAVI